MGKKKSKAGTSTRKGISPAIWIVAVVILVVAALAISGNLPFLSGQKETGKSFNLTEKETKPVIDPALFTGQVRAAYAAAKKYPEILNEVFCYCFCNEPPFRHKTLLSCFTDKHGAGWTLCQKEALRVAQLHEQGKSIKDIKRAIDREFGG